MRATLTLAAVLLAVTPTASVGQTAPPAPSASRPAQTEHDHAAATSPSPSPGRPETKLPTMQERMQAMHAEMTARKARARLDALVKAMNDSPADQQLSSVIAVINELVSQHQAATARPTDGSTPEKAAGCAAMSKADGTPKP